LELLLIRHALPLRVETRDGSAADPALSPVGREQARRLAAWLAGEHVDALYTSPLRRARETAAPLERSFGLRARVEPGVREYDAERDHYIPLEELKAQDPAAWRAFVSGGMYEGIDRDAFERGVVGSLETIAAAHRGERVAVVCHGGVINVWAAHVLGLGPTPFFEPLYTSVSRFLAASSGERSVASLNEASHLRAQALRDAAAPPQGADGDALADGGAV